MDQESKASQGKLEVKVLFPEGVRQAIFANVATVQHLNAQVYLNFGFIDPDSLIPEKLLNVDKINVLASPITRLVLGVNDAINLRDNLNEILERFEQKPLLEES